MDNRKRKTTTHLHGPKTKQPWPNGSGGTRACHKGNRHDNNVPSSSAPLSHCDADNDASSQADPGTMDTHEVIDLIDSLWSGSPEDAGDEDDDAELGQSCYLIMNNSGTLTC